MDIFFKTIARQDVPESIVTDNAFFQARKKLKHGAFVELNQRTNENFYKTNSIERWHGFRLLATDGSTAKVPRTSGCRDYFGELTGNRGDPCPLSRVSQCFDVLNHITIDAVISPLHRDERELAADHFRHLGKEDLLLLDRGYPAFWIFNGILDKGANLCARISSQFAPKIRANFLQSGKQEDIVTITPSPATISKCRKRNLSAQPLHLRIIRIEIDGAEEPEVLLTSLLDTERFPYECFAELYHERVRGYDLII